MEKENTHNNTNNNHNHHNDDNKNHASTTQNDLLLKRRAFRLGILKILAVLLLAAGYCAGVYLLCEPRILGKNVWYSENALLAHAANVYFPHDSFPPEVDAWGSFEEVKQGVRQILSQPGISLPLYSHHYTVKNNNNHTVGENLYTILKSSRSDGTEAMILSSSSFPIEKKYGVGFLLRMITFLKGANWLAKDIILVISDDRPGAPAGLKHWIHDYLTPSSSLSSSVQKREIVHGAFNFDISSPNFSRIRVLPEGINGQLPNMDILHVALGFDGVDPDVSTVVDFFSKAFNHKLIRRELAERLKVLWSFIYHLARGVPTHQHAWANKNEIDCVTIQTIPSQRFNSWAFQNLGRGIEGSLKSMNNLHEILHASFFFYLMDTPWHFLPLAAYFIPFVLILLPFQMKGLNLYFAYEWTNPSKSLILFFLYQIFGIILFVSIFAIHFVNQSLNLALSKHTEITLWLGLSAVMTLIFIITSLIPSKKSQGFDGASFQLFATLPVTLFLATFSILNFGFCLMTLIILVPFYSLFNASTSSKILWLFQLFMLIALSPITIMFVISWVSNLGFVDLVEQVFRDFETYRTLFFPFIVALYVPYNFAHFKLLFSSTPHKHKLKME